MSNSERTATLHSKRSKMVSSMEGRRGRGCRTKRGWGGLGKQEMDEKGRVRGSVDEGLGGECHLNRAAGLNWAVAQEGPRCPAGSLRVPDLTSAAGSGRPLAARTERVSWRRRVALSDGKVGGSPLRGPPARGSSLNAAADPRAVARLPFGPEQVRR